jgi:ribosome-binding protein aMBF1 (putative translation factor)
MKKYICEFCGSETDKLYTLVFTEEEGVKIPLKVCSKCVPEEQVDNVEEAKGNED